MTDKSVAPCLGEEYCKALKRAFRPRWPWELSADDWLPPGEAHPHTHDVDTAQHVSPGK